MSYSLQNTIWVQFAEHTPSQADADWSVDGHSELWVVLEDQGTDDDVVVYELNRKVFAKVNKAEFQEAYYPLSNQATQILRHWNGWAIQ